MTTEIEKIERRTVQYWFQDGLLEMAFGGFLLLLALFFLAEASAPAKSGWRFFLDVGLLPLFIFGGWAMNRTVRSLKHKITYPRTGYVSYRKPERKKRAARGFVIGAAAGILSASMATLFASKSAGFDWMPAGSGVAFALALSILAFRTDLIRLAGLAVFALAAGIVLSFSGWGDRLGLAVFYGTLAVSLFLSGWLTLRRYLRKYRLPDEVSQ
jgi:hypothetical protein